MIILKNGARINPEQIAYYAELEDDYHKKGALNTNITFAPDCSLFVFETPEELDSLLNNWYRRRGKYGYQDIQERAAG